VRQRKDIRRGIFCEFSADTDEAIVEVMMCVVHEVINDHVSVRQVCVLTLYIHIHTHVCVCVCVCVLLSPIKYPLLKMAPATH